MKRVARHRVGVRTQPSPFVRSVGKRADMLLVRH